MVNKLREAAVAIAEGSMVTEASRRVGVAEQTFYRCRADTKVSGLTWLGASHA